MIRGMLAPFRGLGFASIYRNRAARVEAAAAGRIDRAGDIPGQQDTLPGPIFFGIGDRDCREEGL